MSGASGRKAEDALQDGVRQTPPRRVCAWSGAKTQARIEDVLMSV